MFYKVIYFVILGVFAASSAICFLNGILPLMANKYTDDIETKIKALKTIRICTICAVLATIALIFVQ